MRCRPCAVRPARRAGPRLGCGTGLSGTALANAGFRNVSGTDINPDMLRLAQEAHIYRDTWVTDIEDPFSFVPGTYAAMAAIGVIGVGAAPVSLLGEALAGLATGGHIVFSFNDHVLANAEYMHVLDEHLTSGRAAQVFAEHGPHFEGLGSSSTVFVLRRL